MTNGHVRLGKHFCVRQIRVRAPPRIGMKTHIEEQLSSNILRANLAIFTKGVVRYSNILGETYYA